MNNQRRNPRRSEGRSKTPAARTFRTIVYCAAIPAVVFLSQLLVREIFFGPVFAIQRVVTGSNVPAGMDFSVLYGRNIFRVSFAGLAGRMKQDSRIEQFAIRRLFPDGLQVSVKRRTPFAFLYSAGGITLVGRDGVILQDGETFTRPELQLENNNGGELAEIVPIAARVFDYTGNFAPFQSVSFSRSFFSLTLVSGETVYLPRENFAGKLPLFYRILADFRQKGIIYKYLDLRFPDPVFLPG